MGTGIRLRYSTIVNYMSMVYRMVVAVGFAVIVARRLSIGEYGLWGVILSSSLMLATPVLLWSLWAQRFVARGYPGAGLTGLYLTFIYWIPGGLFFLLVAIVEESLVGWGFWYMLLGLPLFLLQTIDRYFRGLISVVKPEASGFRNFVFETSRIALVYISLVVLGMGLDGVIFSVEISLFIALVYMYFVLHGTDVFHGGYSGKLASDWLKSWAFPSLNLATSFLRSGIRAVVSWITGSEEPVAYLNVGFSAEAPLVQASWAGTSALYAKTLRSGSRRDLEETLRLSLLFMGYMLPVFVVLSKTVASIYNPAYISAWLVLVIISFFASFNGLSSILTIALLGVEKVDLHGLPDRKRIFSSYLFKAPMARIIGFAFSYLTFITAILIGKLSGIQAAVAVALSLLVWVVPVFFYLDRKAREELNYRFPVKELASVSLASLGSSLYYQVSGAKDIIVLHFWAQIPFVIFHLTVGLAIYSAILYISSPWMRKLVRDALHYLKKSIH